MGLYYDNAKQVNFFFRLKTILKTALVEFNDRFDRSKKIENTKVNSKLPISNNNLLNSQYLKHSLDLWRE